MLCRPIICEYVTFSNLTGAQPQRFGGRRTAQMVPLQIQACVSLFVKRNTILSSGMEIIIVLQSHKVLLQRALRQGRVKQAWWGLCRLFWKRHCQGTVLLQVVSTSRESQCLRASRQSRAPGTPGLGRAREPRAPKPSPTTASPAGRNEGSRGVSLARLPGARAGAHRHTHILHVCSWRARAAGNPCRCVQAGEPSREHAPDQRKCEILPSRAGSLRRFSARLKCKTKGKHAMLIPFFFFSQAILTHGLCDKMNATEAQKYLH